MFVPDCFLSKRKGVVIWELTSWAFLCQENKMLCFECVYILYDPARFVAVGI